MKYILIIIIFAHGIANAQEEIYPEVFQNAKGVKVIKAFSLDTLVHSYAVGPDGKILSRRDYNKDKVEAKEVYGYENGKIVSLKSYQEREYIYNDNASDTRQLPADFRWDNTKVTFEIKYIQGPYGIVSYKYFANPGNELLTDISYTYNPDGSLKREDIKTYPRSNAQGYLKPNGSSGNNQSAPTSVYGRYKEFAYEPNLTTIYFYVNGKLTGTENIVRTTDGRITIRVLKNNKGKIIGRASCNYNTQGQLMEQLVNDTGEDCFGTGHPVIFDSEVYSYNEKGRMVAKVAYYKGKLVHQLAYRYEE